MYDKSYTLSRRVNMQVFYLRESSDVKWISIATNYISNSDQLRI